jgi:hypothetical protein
VVQHQQRPPRPQRVDDRVDGRRPGATSSTHKVGHRVHDGGRVSASGS